MKLLKIVLGMGLCILPLAAIMGVALESWAVFFTIWGVFTASICCFWAGFTILGQD